MGVHGEPNFYQVLYSLKCFSSPLTKIPGGLGRAVGICGDADDQHMARTAGQEGWCYRTDGADGRWCSAASTLPILTGAQKIEYYLHTTNARATLIR